VGRPSVCYPEGVVIVGGRPGLRGGAVAFAVVNVGAGDGAGGVGRAVAARVSAGPGGVWREGGEGGESGAPVGSGHGER